MTLTRAERQTLLAVAHRAITHGLRHGQAPEVDPEGFPAVLRSVRASFVTLKQDGRLRGCIGGLSAQWPLVLDASRHAFGAAFHDPRFTRLGREEYVCTTVHVSVLSPPEALRFESEAELLAALVPGRDGLIIERGGLRGTFLPAVWESLAEPASFLEHLKQKAGMPASATPAKAWRYTTESFGDEDFPDAMRDPKRGPNRDPSWDPSWDPNGDPK